MSLNIRWTRRTKQLVMTAAISIAATGALGGGLQFYTHYLWQKEKQALAKDLLETKNIMAQYQIDDAPITMTDTWVFQKEMAAGAVVQEEDIGRVRLPASMVPPSMQMSKQDIVGKVMKLQIRSNIPITSELLAQHDDVREDARWVETAVIQLPLELRQNEAIDVRIRFSDGQDYVVLTKKWVKKLQQPTLWMHLSEQELLTMSSAYVDAFINGGQIYALRYIEPMLQQEAIVNYPVNEAVYKLMEKNPNLLETARQALSLQSRKVLEERLQRSAVTQTEAQLSYINDDANHAGGGKRNRSQSQSPFIGHSQAAARTSPFVGEQGLEPSTTELPQDPAPSYQQSTDHQKQLHEDGLIKQSENLEEWNEGASSDSYGDYVRKAIGDSLPGEPKMKTSQ